MTFEPQKMCTPGISRLIIQAVFLLSVTTTATSDSTGNPDYQLFSWTISSGEVLATLPLASKKHLLTGSCWSGIHWSFRRRGTAKKYRLQSGFFRKNEDLIYFSRFE